MSKDEVYRDTDSLSLPVPAGTTAGQPVRIGALVGVTETDRAQSVGQPLAADYNAGGGNAEGYATVRLAGAFRIPVGGPAAEVGQVVYLRPVGVGLLSTERGEDGYPFGFALEPKGATTDVATIIEVAIARHPERLA